MGKATYGTGTIFKRGRIWYLSYYVDGQQVVRSSRSANVQDAKRLRDQILGKKSRGELGDTITANVTCGELLDDLLEHAKANIKASTEKIWRFVVEASIRPFFGHRKAANLTTAIFKEYRRQRLAEGKSDSTCNRELSMLRTAFNLGRKCTPPKVLTIPYFPMVAETNVRQGFLTDEEYAKLRDALPEYLRSLFVTAYFTGVRLGELLSIEWRQVDWEQGYITLESERTRSGHARVVPILDVFGGREQSRQIDQRWDFHRPLIGEKRTALLRGEPQCALSRLVIDEQQVIDLQHGPRSLPGALRTTPLCAAHQDAAPSVGSRVSDSTKERLVGRRMKRTRPKFQCRFQRKPLRVREPAFVVFERRIFPVPARARPQAPHEMRRALEVNVHENFAVHLSIILPWQASVLFGAP